MKKGLVVTIAAVCLFIVTGMLPQGSVSAEPEDSGYRQFDRQKITFENPSDAALKRRSASELPARYDMREQSYAQYIKVKNQKNTEMCWAFAVTTTAEITLLHQQSRTSSSIAPAEFSPVHLAYFLYNRQNDRLGNTGKDKNIAGYGRTYSEAGGNNLMTFQSLAGWTGLASEIKAPFGDALPDTLSAKLAYDNDYIIESAEFIGNDSMTATISEVKAAIYDHGAAAADIYMSSKYMNSDTGAYITNTQSSNHIVTIVGWDDNYSKDNFLSSSESGSSAGRPQNDGAWIVQNSFGSDWGDEGYFYVSYEDTSLSDPMVLTLAPADTYDYNYQYDGSSNIEAVKLETGEKAANVFTSPECPKTQYLRAVGFTGYNADSTSYKVDIYKSVKGTSSPVNGTKACDSFTVTTDNIGFNIFELPQAVKIAGGTRYSVVITAKSDTYIGAETSGDYDWVKFQAGTTRNQSYYYDTVQKTWIDFYNHGACARIKAFTTENKPINIADARATLSTLYYKCTGVQRRPVPVVRYNGKYLRNGTDYTLSYGTNKYPGYGYIYITGKGDYTGSLTKKFYISRVSGMSVKSYGTGTMTINWKKQDNVSGYKVYRYVSGAYKCIGSVKGADTTQYKVKNLSAGRGYSLKVRAYKTAAGKTYYGLCSSILYAPSKPAAASMTKLTSGTSHYVRAYWKQRTCTGYQVKIARNSGFTTGVRTYRITSYKTTSKKMTGLSKGKYYYVKVRAYKTYGGRTVYGSWSRSLKIKCR